MSQACAVKVDLSGIWDITNKAYWKYLDDFRRYQIFKGGAGAGKSVFLSQRDIYHLLSIPGYNIMILRKIARDNHDTTFAEMKKAIYSGENLNQLFKINESKGAEEIVCLVNGNKVIFRGLDNVNQLKSTTFETGDLVEIRIEEADETSEEDFNQLDLRLRGIGEIPKHLVMSFNPIDVTSWIKSRFFDCVLGKDDGFICETTYHDNRYLDSEYIKNLERLKNIDWYYYQVYVLNQWGARTVARVFANLKIHDFDIPDRKMKNLRAGADFGFNHASAFERVGFVDGEMYIYSEVYMKNKLNHDFIEAIKRVHPASLPITGDSANPDKIEEANIAGLNMYGAIKGKDSVRQVIDWMKSLPAIHVHATNCPNAARELTRFKYRQLKDGRVIDEFVEIDDDTVAAIRYAVEDIANYGQNKGKNIFADGAVSW